MLRLLCLVIYEIAAYNIRVCMCAHLCLCVFSDIYIYIYIYISNLKSSVAQLICYTEISGCPFTITYITLLHYGISLALITTKNIVITREHSPITRVVVLGS